MRHYTRSTDRLGDAVLEAELQKQLEVLYPVDKYPFSIDAIGDGGSRVTLRIERAEEPRIREERTVLVRNFPGSNPTRDAVLQTIANIIEDLGYPPAG